MSSYQQTRQKKRNLKQNMQFSALENDISNDDFDTYYQKCQVQKKLRLQSQETVVEDSDTNSSGYSSASSPSPSPSPSLSTYEDEGDGDVWDENDEYDYLTNEEIDRAFYEAEKWADF